MGEKKRLRKGEVGVKDEQGKKNKGKKNQEENHDVEMKYVKKKM